VTTASSFREFGAGDESEDFFAFSWARGVGEVAGLGDTEEFYRGDFEGKFLVAFPADVRGGFALDGYYSW
jgi:hypothetical protein